jgi:4a-hydroxytetrahydrobiopterin dehydratase
MEHSVDELTPDQVLDAGLDDWRKLAQALHARFRTGSFTAGLDLVAAITEVAERADHHPDVTLTYPVVDVRLMSHDVGAVTQRDVDLAREISAIARDRGVAADPAAPTVLELALDTADHGRIGAFWAAVLTGDAANVQGNDVVDKTGQVPLLWFQDTDDHDEPRQRFHLDVWVPHDQAQARIDAALAAGGTLVDETEKPSFVVLADADGNKACICTMLDRG